MKNLLHCRWCLKPRVSLPSGVLVCTTCDLTPDSTIPAMGNTKP